MAVDYFGRNFNDPIVRCDACNRIVHRVYISHRAGCNSCGNKRFRSLTGLSQEEFTALENGTYDLGLKSYTIDPDYLSLFEDCEEVEVEK